MRVAIYDYYLRHAEKHLQSFGKRLDRHRQDFVRVSLDGPPPLCDLPILWGFMRRDVFAAQRISGGRLLLKRGYIGNRKKWTSVGYDGLNGWPDFCNRGKSPERFREHFDGLLQP